MKKFFLFFLALLVLCGCEDDDFKIDNREETIKGQWSFKSITLRPAIDLNNDDVPNTNGFEELESCLFDDLYFFGDTGGETNVFSIEENASRCEDTPQGSTSKFRDNYIFNDDKTILSFVESDVIYFIQEISGSTLELEIEEVINDQNIRLNYTFKRD